MRRRPLARRTKGPDLGPLDDEDYDRLLASDESSSLERKASIRSKRGLFWSVTEAIAALLNSDGGFVIVGQEDDKHIRGIEPDFEQLGSRRNADAFAIAFENALEAHLGPDAATSVDLRLVARDGKTLAIIACRPHDEPVFRAERLERGTLEKVFFVRRGTTTRPLQGRDVVRYIAHRWPGLDVESRRIVGVQRRVIVLLVAVATFLVGSGIGLLARVRANEPAALDQAPFYEVRNLTTGGSWAHRAFADPGDNLLYRIRISGTKKLENVSVHASFPTIPSAQISSSAEVSAARTSPRAVGDTVDVFLSRPSLVEYGEFTTQLVDARGRIISTLQEGITSGRIAIGDLDPARRASVRFMMSVKPLPTPSGLQAADFFVGAVQGAQTGTYATSHVSASSGDTVLLSAIVKADRIVRDVRLKLLVPPARAMRHELTATIRNPRVPNNPIADAVVLRFDRPVTLAYVPRSMVLLDTRGRLLRTYAGDVIARPIAIGEVSPGVAGTRVLQFGMRTVSRSR